MAGPPSTVADWQRLARLGAAHRARYGEWPRLLARAPGRINLIGEHTDYNEGWVLPAAIDRDTLVAASPRADRRLGVASLNLPPPAELVLDELEPTGAWSDFPAGVAYVLQRGPRRLAGANLTVESTIPPGAGLSSSAALAVASALALLATSNLELAPAGVARLCQRADHEFVGVKSGIMDQSIAVHGRRDHALLLDCRSLAMEQVPLSLPGLSFVVCDSGVRHAHAAGAYNRRGQECEAATAVLRGLYPDIVSLRDITLEQLEGAARRLPAWRDTTAYRRARHVISENARVGEFVLALRQHQWRAVGDALYASHASLRDDYEVSVPEIEALMALAREVNGVVGARLMGGGFGGSVLALVRDTALDAFTSHVAEGYAARTGRTATVRRVRTADGARVHAFPPESE